MKILLVIVIIAPVYTGPEEIPSQCDSSVMGDKIPYSV